VRTSPWGGPLLLAALPTIAAIDAQETAGALVAAFTRAK